MVTVPCGVHISLVVSHNGRWGQGLGKGLDFKSLGTEAWLRYLTNIWRKLYIGFQLSTFKRVAQPWLSSFCSSPFAYDRPRRAVAAAEVWSCTLRRRKPLNTLQILNARMFVTHWSAQQLNFCVSNCNMVSRNVDVYEVKWARVNSHLYSASVWTLPWA